TLCPSISTRMTRAVNAPRSSNSTAIQSSKLLMSEVDTRRLRHRLLEQGPERSTVRRCIPLLELGQRLCNTAIKLLIAGFEAGKERLRDGREPGKEWSLAFSRPIKLRTQSRESFGNRRLLGLGAGDGISDSAHQIEPA